MARFFGGNSNEIICFRENKCQFCLRRFCYKDCDAQHEEQHHQINPTNDQLVPHECSRKKIQETNKNEPPLPQTGSVGFTSTPLNNRIKRSDRSYFKSTENVIINHSKNNKRRVRFSEASSVKGPSKKIKFRKATPRKRNQVDVHLDGANDCDSSSDDSFVSFKDTNETMAIDNALNEEKESGERIITTYKKCDASAGPSNFNLSLQINVFNDNRHQSTNIWSSITNIVTSITSNNLVPPQNARIKSLEYEMPHLKQMKLTDLKCRRSIRNLSPAYKIRLDRLKFVDKATQTDEIWM